MKSLIWGIIVIIILAAAGFGGWYFFLKKSPEGGACRNQSTCQTGLKCINKICSSGAKGSVCAQKSDCQTGFCVNSQCTEGKLSEACNTYRDCETGLLCQKGSCIQKPDYSKYFDKVVISKMKPGSPPGPNNPLTETATFTSADSIEIDFLGVKSTTVGDYQVECINATTGEMVFSSQDRTPTKFEGRDTGMGTDLSGITPGQYDMNVYFKDELVYSTTITLN